jgi:hypothetical protein
MDAHILASRLTPEMFPGRYLRESETYSDLKKALSQAAGPEATVHVQQQDHGTLRPVEAFGQRCWPDAVVRLQEHSIAVEAKLLHHPQESGALCSAIGQAMIFSLDHEEALIVLLQAPACPTFTSRERGILDRLWPCQRIATAIVPVASAGTTLPTGAASGPSQREELASG